MLCRAKEQLQNRVILTMIGLFFNVELRFINGEVLGMHQYFFPAPPFIQISLKQLLIRHAENRADSGIKLE